MKRSKAAVPTVPQRAPWSVVSTVGTSYYQIRNQFTGFTRSEKYHWYSSVNLKNQEAFIECDRLNREAGFWTSYAGEPCPDTSRYIIPTF